MLRAGERHTVDGERLWCRATPRSATGATTEIGRISGMLAVEALTTPLVRQMDSFARWLTVLILLVAAILLVYGYFVGHHDFAEICMAVVGLSVAAIPEGLPAVLTITRAIGVLVWHIMLTLVVMEIFHLFFIRNMCGTSLTWKAVRGTKVVWVTVIVTAAAQFAIIEFEKQIRLRIRFIRGA